MRKRSPARISSGDGAGGSCWKVPPRRRHGFHLPELSPICSLAPLSWISSTGDISGSAHRVIKNTHLKNGKTKKTRNQSNLIRQDCSEATSSYNHRKALIPSPSPQVWREGQSSSPHRRGCYYNFLQSKTPPGQSCINPRAPFPVARKETQPEVTPRIWRQATPPNHAAIVHPALMVPGRILSPKVYTWGFNHLKLLPVP